jgi:1-deoxy-D-xylulose-5-phosphate synthase
MATKGFKPFCGIYSTFLQRGYDPIIHDVCLQNLPVVFCMDRAGLSGDDGPTHHGLFDIAYLRGVPNIMLMAPKDEDELADMLYMAMLHDGPSAVRYPRGVGLGVEVKARPGALPVGKAEIVRDGDEVAVLALGAMFDLGKKLVGALEREGLSAALINPRFIKPLDLDVIGRCARRVRLLITLVDHVAKGGFGSAVLEAISEIGLSTPVVRIGWPDQFIEHGKVDQLRAKYGLTVEAAMKEVRNLLVLTAEASA